MNEELLKLQDKEAKYTTHGKALYSMSPAQTMFGYTYHAHMIPPFKPTRTLMLGYGNGTISDLIRMIHGSDSKIVGVDVVQADKPRLEYMKVLQDAREFVDVASNGLIKDMYDYVCVDLWEGQEVPEFVFSEDFARKLSVITRYLMCINIPTSKLVDMRCYYDLGFKCDRWVNVDGNTILWWSISSNA